MSHSLLKKTLFCFLALSLSAGYLAWDSVKKAQPAAWRDASSSAYQYGYVKFNRADDYTIKPGIGIGQVFIGQRREDLRQIAGSPRNLLKGMENVDSYAGFDVVYENDRVVKIVIDSPLFHTVEGISANSKISEYQAVFPSAKRICYRYPAGVPNDFASMGEVYDAVEDGLAIDYITVAGSRELHTLLYIHAPLKSLQFKHEEIVDCPGQ